MLLKEVMGVDVSNSMGWQVELAAKKPKPTVEGGPNTPGMATFFLERLHRLASMQGNPENRNLVSWATFSTLMDLVSLGDGDAALDVLRRAKSRKEIAF